LIRYMLDTNIVSALIRHPRGFVAERMARAGGSAVCCTSIIVAGELRFGAIRRKSARLFDSVEAVLASLPVLALDAGADRRYGAVRATLEAAGGPIGANDLWIASHALAADLTLVTGNVSEFSRVDGLRWENWLPQA
jgi:tRNA(fMet)-specific endonuclease VapC